MAFFRPAIELAILSQEFVFVRNSWLALDSRRARDAPVLDVFLPTGRPGSARRCHFGNATTGPSWDRDFPCPGFPFQPRRGRGSARKPSRSQGVGYAVGHTADGAPAFPAIALPRMETQNGATAKPTPSVSLGPASDLPDRRLESHLLTRRAWRGTAFENCDSAGSC